jgi:hypothetical protein
MVRSEAERRIRNDTCVAKMAAITGAESGVHALFSTFCHPGLQCICRHYATTEAGPWYRQSARSSGASAIPRVAQGHTSRSGPRQMATAANDDKPEIERIEGTVHSICSTTAAKKKWTSVWSSVVGAMSHVTTAPPETSSDAYKYVGSGVVYWTWPLSLARMHPALRSHTQVVRSRLLDSQMRTGTSGTAIPVTTSRGVLHQYKLHERHDLI